MIIYSSGRQTGKTTALIDEMYRDTEALLVVHNYTEVQRLVRDYPSLEDRVLSIDHVISGKLRGRKYSQIHIDNLDIVLPYLIGGRIGTVMMTEENE